MSNGPEIQLSQAAGISHFCRHPGSEESETVTTPGRGVSRTLQRCRAQEASCHLEDRPGMRSLQGEKDEM
jgi:hypothetical protein